MLMLSEEKDVPILRRLLLCLLEEIEISKRSFLWHGGGVWAGRYIRDGQDVTEVLLQNEREAREMLRKVGGS